ncbi:MauE/DoxX family redox-associated membrane protein [Amycolatopsis lurida]
MRTVLTLVFLLAALGKLRSPAGLAETIDRVVRLPRPITVTLTALTIIAELTAVVLLAAGGGFLHAGLVLAAVLLAAFSAVVLVAIRRGQRVRCACFGRSPYFMSGDDLARNVILLGATVAAIALHSAKGAATGFLPAVHRPAGRRCGQAPVARVVRRGHPHRGIAQPAAGRKRCPRTTRRGPGGPCAAPGLQPGGNDAVLLRCRRRCGDGHGLVGSPAWARLFENLVPASVAHH